jgi:hypothetical protein
MRGKLTRTSWMAIPDFAKATDCRSMQFGLSSIRKRRNNRKLREEEGTVKLLASVCRFLATFAAMAFLLMSAGCKKTTPATPSNGQGSAQAVASPQPHQPLPAHGSGYAHVTYQPNVRIMEAEEGKKALIGVSTDEASLLFDSSNATARSLKAGDVLMIKGLLVRNVLGAEATPDGILVLTQHALITDLIQDGEIHVQAPVRFGAPVASLVEPPHPFFSSWEELFATPAYAQSPEGVAMSNAEAKGTLDAYGNIVKGVLKGAVEGWETTFQATPSEGQTKLDITLKKDVGGFVALITGQGTLSNFEFDSTIGISKSTLQNMETNFGNLNGQMNFQWQVAKDSPGIMADESKIKLPGAIEVPLSEFLEGIPMYLEVSGAILIHPAITAGKEFTKGQFRISYDGYQHFKIKPGNLDANGNVSGDIELQDHSELSPTAPLGMLVALAAPRIELTLGLNKIYDKSDIKKAADIVDKIADQVAKHLLSAEKYADYQKNGIHLGEVFKNALSTDGAAHFQMVGTSASSYSGMSSITPCARFDLNLVGSVGASAEAWGQSIGTVSKEIFRKGITKVDPPGMKLCENIGKN